MKYIDSQYFIERKVFVEFYAAEHEELLDIRENLGKMKQVLLRYLA